MKNSLFCITAAPTRSALIGLSLAVGALACAGQAQAQAAPGNPAAVVPPRAAATDLKAAAPQRSAIVAKPLWAELSAAQRTALAPLASHWDALSATQKRKWITLSKNHHELPATDQALMHARMDDWVMLSPQQRRTARLNFAETKRLSSTEKQQQWEAYQALSPDARHKLTESAPALPPGAAVAVRPVPPQKLATVPMAGPGANARLKLAAPNQIDPHTLLPQRVDPARGTRNPLAPSVAQP